MPLIQPTTQPARWRAALGETVYTGQTALGQATGVNPDYALVHAEGDAAYVAELESIADALPALPDSGWLEAGDVYQHGGHAIMVRQSHWRTEHNPADVLALFVVYRADAADVLEWVAGESVQVGTRRTYGGVTYECLQAHTTQPDWTPPQTIGGLWELVVEAPDEPQPWVQPTGAHDAYPAGARVTHNGYIWESDIDANVWEPPMFWTQIE